MYRPSIFALLAAAMTFAAEGVNNITVNASVDSRINSVTVKAGSQSMSLNKDGSASWARWVVGDAYSVTASGVATGYTAKWKVSTNNVVALSGGAGDAITLPTDSFTGCALRFYGDPNQYAVALDGQSGSGGSSSVTATYDTAMPSATMPTRTGYTFGGYWTAANGGGTQYYKADGTSATNWNIASTATLYAKWTAKTYTVTLKANNNQSLWPLVNPTFPDGTANDKTFPATYDQKYPTLVTGVPSSPGYTFKNWYDATTGTHFRDGVQLDDLTVKITQNSSFFAQWTANKYAVTLDRQSGAGGSSGVTATFGQAMPSVSPPSRAGYTFGGYYSAANGGGTQYYKADGTSARAWNVASATTLYAKWTAITYTATVAPGTGGTGGAGATYTVSSSAQTKTITLPTRTGYRIASWAFSGYTGSAPTISGTTLTIPANTYGNFTATPSWEAIRYTVTVAAGTGGTGGAGTTYTISSSPQTKSITLPTRTGYHVASWAFAGYTGSVPFFQGDSTLMILADTYGDFTATPTWEASTYTVTLDRQGGSSDTGSVAATYDAAMPSAAMPTRAGYTFGGYWTERNGAGTQYYKVDGTSARTWNVASATTLYAKWTAKTYTVTLRANSNQSLWPLINATFPDGTANDKTFPATYDQKYPTLVTGVPSSPGYSFKNWYNGTDQTHFRDGVQLDNLTVKITQDSVFLAQWTANRYAVTLDRQSGSGGSSGVTATYGAAMPTATMPSRTGYSFGGYWTGANGSGTQYYTAAGASARNWNFATNKTLYAKWTANTYAVTLDRQSGTGGSSGVTATYGAAMPSATMPSRTGYSFGGYYTETNGVGTQYYTAAGASARNWNFATNKTLYAKWTAETYTVRFQPRGGTATPDVQATYDAAMPRITPPTRTGYTFGGYWTGENGTGTQYYKSDGASARSWDIANSTTYLNAKWTANAYTVKFQPRGGTATPDVRATYGAAMPAITPPTREGYTFDGYYTETNGGGTRYYNADGTSAHAWDIAADTTYLNANWTPVTYMVTVAGGAGGTAGTGATYTIKTSAQTKSITLPTRAGCRVASWTFSGYAGSSAAPTISGTTLTIPANAYGNITATPTWEMIEYTVTVAGGTGGTAGTGATYAISSSMQAKAITLPTRKGYHVASWTFDGYTGSVPFFQGSSTLIILPETYGDITATPTWEASSYTVTLAPGGDFGGTAEVTATYDAAMRSITPPTRTGYTFGGYWSAANGGGTQYYKADGTSARTWNIAADATLYAKWTAKEFIVQFWPHGGSPGTPSVTATYDAPMPAITPNIALTGHEFLGYYTGIDSGTKYYNANGTSAHVCDFTSHTNLIASWKASTYTVTLDRQSGSGGAPSVQATYNAAMPTPIDRPTRDGYTFGGYYSAANGGGTRYYNADGTSARTWNVASATTLYAKWTAKRYTVTLKANNNQSLWPLVNATFPGGTTNDKTFTVTYDQKYPPLTSGVPSSPGYTFKNWYDSTNDKHFPDGVQLTNETVKITQDSPFWAQWKANEYTVALNRQSGTGGSSSATATYAAAMRSISPPTRTGYTFGGYYSAANGGGTRYYTADGASARTWNIPSNTTLYAKWTANTYKVTLDRRSGSGGTTNVTATYDAAMRSISPPTRTGYTFGGYYSAANGGGTQYYKADGTSAWSWDIAFDTTLYAYWTPKKYTVQFWPHGGAPGTTNVTATYDSPMPTITPNIARTGYDFLGYYTGIDSGTQYYNANGTSAHDCDFTSNTNLIAAWRAHKYTVTLDWQSGSGGAPSVQPIYNAAMPTPIGLPERVGYTFGGYWTGVNGTGTNYYTAAGASARNWNIPWDATLYAKWVADTYKVTLKANNDSNNWPLIHATFPDGTANDKTLTVTYGQKYPKLTSGVPSSPGYTFKNWYNETDWQNLPDGVQLTNETVEITKDSVFLAKWTANTYTVTLDRQSGTGGSSSVTATYGAGMPSMTKPTRDGYTFGGYWTGANGVGTQYYTANGTSAQAWDIITNTTLYAKWTADTYTVTLNRKSGNGGSSSVQATYNAAMPSATMPTRDGYTFGGYWTGENGTGTNYYTAAGASARNWNISLNTTLYAKWTVNTYKVTLKANNDQSRWLLIHATFPDGTANDKTLTVTYDQKYPTLISGVPSSPGYTFKNWYNETDWQNLPDGVQLTNETVKITQNSVFLALWTPNTYIVRFNANGGSGTPKTQEFKYGEAEALMGNPFSRKGYDFAGWAASADGAVVYEDREEVMDLTATDRGTVDLYAKWTAKTYKLTVRPNGGVWEKGWPEGGGRPNGTEDFTQEGVLKTGDPAWNSMRVPTRTGYTFAGWWTASSSGTQVYDVNSKCLKGDYWTDTAANGGTYQRDGDMTLYAHWTPKEFVVQFWPHGGAPGTPSVTATYDAPMPTITPNIALTGYDFQGYYTGIDSGTQYYNADGTSAHVCDFTSNTNLIASWKASTYTVTLDRQSGSGGSSSVQATYNAAMPSATMPTRTGYTFGGYYTAANGGGTQYYTAAGTSARNWNIATNTTLYAKWTANTYTVTLKANNDHSKWPLVNATFPDGTANDKTLTVTYDQKYPKLTSGVPSSPGYAFKNWYNETDRTNFCDGVQLTNETVEITRNSTFLAQWTPNSYTVSFDPNGGEGEMDSIICTYGVPTNLPPCSFERDGWGFKGWMTNVNAGVLFVDQACVTDLTTTAGADVTMYACWTGVTYQVVLDARYDLGDGIMTNGVVKEVIYVQPPPQPPITNLVNETVSVLTNSYVVGDAWNLPTPENAKPYLAFDGWGYWNAQGNWISVSNEVDRVPPSSTGATNLVATWKWWRTVGEFGGDAVEAPDLTFRTFGTKGKGNIDDDPYPAEWFVQANIFCEGTNAVQSGALPEVGEAGLGEGNPVYASWLVMEMPEPCVLKFKWKCLATRGEQSPYGDWLGDSLHFGKIDETGALTDLTHELTGDVAWVEVVYTNVEKDVQFAWQFRFKGSSSDVVGGGTGWVDHVEWTPIDTYKVTFDARDPRGDGTMTNSVGNEVSVLANTCIVGDVWKLPAPVNGNVNLKFSYWAYVDEQGVTNNVLEKFSEVPPESEGVTNLVAVWTESVEPVFDPADLAAAVDAPKLLFATLGTVGVQGHYGEGSYLADWIAQTNVVYGSRSAAQSGTLPSCGDGYIYASWLTVTNLSGRGVLSFWWKCSALESEHDPDWDQDMGESFHFGRIEEGGELIDLTEKLTGDVEWVKVVYTNTLEGPVTFAWQVRLEGLGDNAVGGGTGWVDRVTWTPEGSEAADVTAAHAVPHSWLREKFPGYDSADADALERLAEGGSPNGKPMKVWEEYWAGTNPNDPNDVFRAYIAVSNDVPYISWRPDLSVTGDPQRVYHVLCAPIPSAQVWVEWPGPGDSGAATNRFFKVELDWEGSKKND